MDPARETLGAFVKSMVRPAAASYARVDDDSALEAFERDLRLA